MSHYTDMAAKCVHAEQQALARVEATMVVLLTVAVHSAPSLVSIHVRRRGGNATCTTDGIGQMR